MSVEVLVPLLALDPDLDPPTRMRSGDAAADLPARESVRLEPGEQYLMPTGFAIAVPQNYCGLILPRSGLALRHGLTVVNSPGLIDSGYRGELQVILLNTGLEAVELERGQRIAQLVIVPVPAVSFVATAELPDSIDSRGTDGFGSSG